MSQHVLEEWFSHHIVLPEMRMLPNPTIMGPRIIRKRSPNTIETSQNTHPLLRGLMSFLMSNGIIANRTAPMTTANHNSGIYELEHLGSAYAAVGNNVAIRDSGAKALRILVLVDANVHLFMLNHIRNCAKYRE